MTNLVLALTRWTTAISRANVFNTDSSCRNLGMDTSENEKAKRRFERFEVETRVKVSVIRKGDKIVFSGTAHDISIGGMAVFLSGDLNIGETATVTFALVFSTQLVLQGVVRSRDRYEYGIEWLNPTQSQQDEIVRNCRALSLLK
jgi:c-di-GMP-binding flagellar brake protein YcgR